MDAVTPIVDGDDTATTFQRARAVLSRELSRRALPLLDRVTSRSQLELPLLELALTKLDPTLSLCAIRARVVAVRPETHDVTSFVLRPNARFQTFRPGSYVTLKLTIAGRPVQRSYSISSAPSSDGLFTITVKRVAGGAVSNWLADNVRVGSVLELSAPAGQFVLPAKLPSRLLLLSAGSGITPVMSILRSLIAGRVNIPITFLHFARTPRDIVFYDELSRIAAEASHVRMSFCVEQTQPGFEAAVGRFSESLLRSVAPDFAELDTYLCGPGPFMRAVIESFEQAGADLARLRYERFGGDFDASQFLTQGQVVRFTRSGGESIASQPSTILEQAERLGIEVESGCRAGNCGTCRCLKRRGVVTDIVTGRDSGDGEEFFLPCVSVARGTVEVEL